MTSTLHTSLIHTHFTDASNNPHHLCMVTYHMSAGFVPSIKSLKKCIPCHPTWSSTKKHECGTQGPKGVVSVSAAAGGVLAATAPGQLIHGEKQVINFKSKMALD